MTKMKKIATIVLSVAMISTLSSALIVSAYSASGNSKNRILLLTPATNETVDVVDDSVRTYWNASSEESQIKILNENERLNKGSIPVSLTWTNNKSEFYKVYISENSSFENAYVENVFG